MALSSSIVWEIRPLTGSANNGGGFDSSSGVPGTDYSKQAAAQISWLAVGGTYANDLSLSNASPSIATSAALAAANGTGFLPAHVGNLINITAGTHVTAGRYQITSVSGGAATLDRQAVTDAPHADASGYLGGAIASLDTIYLLLAAGHTVNQVYGASTYTFYVPGSAGTTIKSALYSVLSGDAELAALVGTRIYPGISPFGAAFPKIIYRRTGEPHEHHMEGAAGLATATIMISAYDTTNLGADQVSDAIRNVIDGHPDAFTALDVQGCFLEDRADLVIPPQDASSQAVHGVISKYQITYAESIPTG